MVELAAVESTSKAGVPQHGLNLTAEQAVCVSHLGSPMLVLAGPGTGKTQVLSCRVISLLCSGLKPEEITAITFTNKAATEMRARLRKLGVKKKNLPHISTLHSLASGIIRANSNLCGLPATFRIVNQLENKIAVIDAILDTYPLEFRKKGFLKFAIAEIAKMKAAGKRAQDHKNPVLRSIHDKHEKILSKYSALDFQDLILKGCALLETHETVLKEARSKAAQLLVDEFQDINPGEYKLVQLLAGRADGLFVVGDDDQSIYGWRGGDPGIIVNFEQDFKASKAQELTICHRCPEHILHGALSLVSKNTVRRSKGLASKLTGGSRIRYVVSPSDVAEAAWIAREIKGLVSRPERPYRPGDCAILFRGGDIADKAVSALKAEGISVARLSEQDATSAESVQYLIAHVRLAFDRSDDLALRTCLFSKSAFNLGPVAARTIRRTAERENLSLWNSLQELCIRKKHKTLQKALSAFTAFVDDLFDRISRQGIFEVLTYLAKALKVDGEFSVARFLARVRHLPAGYPLAQLIEDLSAGDLPGEDEAHDEDAVSVITTHAVKGMENKVVFVLGMEQGGFPSPGTAEELEEQRRLCYVAMTRAKARLYLCYAKMRKGRAAQGISFRDPSQFLSEIDSGRVERIFAGTRK